MCRSSHTISDSCQPQTHHDAMQQSLRLIGGKSPGSKTPGDPASLLPALDSSRLIPDVSGHPAKTAPVENLSFSVQSAHPDCWNLSRHVHSNEQRNQGLPLRHNRGVDDNVKNCNCGTTTVFYAVPIPGTCTTKGATNRTKNCTCKGSTVPCTVWHCAYLSRGKTETSSTQTMN